MEDDNSRAYVSLVDRQIDINIQMEKLHKEFYEINTKLQNEFYEINTKLSKLRAEYPYLTARTVSKLENEDYKPFTRSLDRNHLIKRGDFIEFKDHIYGYIYMGEVYKVSLNNQNKYQYYVIRKPQHERFGYKQNAEKPVQYNQIISIITQDEYAFLPTTGEDWRRAKRVAEGERQEYWDNAYIQFRTELFAQKTLLDGTSKKKDKNSKAKRNKRNVSKHPRNKKSKKNSKKKK